MFYIVFIDLANFNFLQRYRSVESDNVDEHAAVAMNGNGDEQHDDDFLGWLGLRWVVCWLECCLKMAGVAAAQVRGAIICAVCF